MVAAEQAAASSDLALPATMLVDERDAAACAQDATASTTPTLAEDKWRQEKAATKQCRADNKRVMALVMPPNPVDGQSGALGRMRSMRCSS